RWLHGLIGDNAHYRLPRNWETGDGGLLTHTTLRDAGLRSAWIDSVVERVYSYRGLRLAISASDLLYAVSEPFGEAEESPRRDLLTQIITQDLMDARVDAQTLLGRQDVQASESMLIETLAERASQQAGTTVPIWVANLARPDPDAIEQPANDRIGLLKRLAELRSLRRTVHNAPPGQGKSGR